MLTQSLVKVDTPVLYRYFDSQRYTDCGYNKPWLTQYLILRETEKSYIVDDYGRERRVPKTGKNVYAWDTEEKALFNYYKRKRRHEFILEQKLKDAKANLRWAKDELEVRKKYREENPASTILKEER